MTPKQQGAYDLQQHVLRILQERGGWQVDRTKMRQMELTRRDPDGEVVHDQLILPTEWTELGDAALLVLAALVQVLEVPAPPARSEITVQLGRELRVLFSAEEGAEWRAFVKDCNDHFLVAALRVIDPGGWIKAHNEIARRIRHDVFYELSDLLALHLGEDDDEAEADVKRRLAELLAARDLQLPRDLFDARQELVGVGMARIEAEYRLRDLVRAVRPLIDALEASGAAPKQAAAVRAALEDPAEEVLSRNHVDRMYFLARREAQLSQAREQQLRRHLSPVLTWAREVLARRDAEAGPASLDRAIVEKTNDVSLTVGDLRALVRGADRDAADPCTPVPGVSADIVRRALDYLGLGQKLPDNAPPPLRDLQVAYEAATHAAATGTGGGR